MACHLLETCESLQVVFVWKGGISCGTSGEENSCIDRTAAGKQSIENTIMM